MPDPVSIAVVALLIKLNEKASVNLDGPTKRYWLFRDPWLNGWLVISDIPYTKPIAAFKLCSHQAMLLYTYLY